MKIAHKVMKIDTMNKNYQTKYDRNKERKKNMGKLCWPNTGRGEAHIPGALHCRSSTCYSLYIYLVKLSSLDTTDKISVLT